MTKIYLIPEVQHKGRYFFASGAEKVNPLPISVPGFRTWLLTSSLDCFCAPYTLVAVPESSQKTKLYKVRFPGGEPDFKRYNLQIKQIDEGNVIYIDTEKFWEIESRVLCVQMVSTKWKAKRSFYHSLSALYHLGIIPALSESTFSTVTDISKYEFDLNAQYGTEKGLQESLHYIFRSTLYALDLFGFTETDDPKTKEYIEYTKSIVENDNNNYFAFAQIGYAIENYNVKCKMHSLLSQDEKSNQFLTGYSYKMLIKSVLAVAHLLKQLGYDVADNCSLSSVISKFQEDMNLQQTGICDSKTLRVIWNESLSSSMALPVIFDKAGFTPQELPHENDNNIFLEPNSNIQNNSLQMNLLYILNHEIANIPYFRTYELWMEKQIEKELNEIAMKCVALNHRIEGISKRTKSAKAIIARTTEMNKRCDELLNQSSRALNDILTSHMKAQAKFEEIRNYISIQRRTNHILGFCGFIFVMLYIIRILHIFVLK